MNKNQYLKLLEILIPVLRCPACHTENCINLREGSIISEINVKLANKHLLCKQCKTSFPITDDYIPIMYSKELPSIFFERKESRNDIKDSLNANIAIYDNISSEYNIYNRRNEQNAKRMQSAASLIIDYYTENSLNDFNESNPILHLDFGCGPGHVIEWLNGMKVMHIGLDVSVNNLRIARKNTGCLVVCGDACNLPFNNGTFELVTESSVLHHILDWKTAINESIRVCKKKGGIIIDSEPSKDRLDWSPLAIWIYNRRFSIYKVLSYFMGNKYIYRNTEEAKLNLLAEIHQQPGTGFPLDELKELFANKGFLTDIICSPTPKLQSKAAPGWQYILVNSLSLKYPWNPKYGNFIAISKNA